MRALRQITSLASRHALVALAAAVLLPSVGSAQLIGTSARTSSPVGYSTIVSLNPVLLIARGGLSLDIERRVATSNTLGASVSSFDWGDASYLTIEARGRYYVTGRAFDGLSIGVVGGLVRLREDSTNVKDYGMNIGFTLDQQWLAGAEERVALTLGLGATRVFFAEDRPSFKSVLPIFRASIGWGF